jgi:hypothetical protein
MSAGLASIASFDAEQSHTICAALSDAPSAFTRGRSISAQVRDSVQHSAAVHVSPSHATSLAVAVIAKIVPRSPLPSQSNSSGVPSASVSAQVRVGAGAGVPAVQLRVAIAASAPSSCVHDASQASYAVTVAPAVFVPVLELSMHPAAPLAATKAAQLLPPLVHAASSAHAAAGLGGLGARAPVAQLRTAIDASSASSCAHDASQASYAVTVAPASSVPVTTATPHKSENPAPAAKLAQALPT